MPAKISLKASSETILDGPCAYHEAALEADPEARFLLKNLQAVVTGLRNTNEKERGARRGLAKARAKRAFANGALDRAVGIFDFKLQELTGKNRDSALYRKYFPDGGITPVVTAPIEEELRLAATILSQIESAAPGAPERVSLDVLKPAHELLRTANQGVKDALQQISNAFAAELESRMAVARQLEIDEAELMKKFGKGARLNTFFLRREEEEREEAPSAEGAPPAQAVI